MSWDQDSYKQPFRGCEPQSVRCVLVAFVLIVPLAGCNSFGNGKLIQQLRGENERLLTEFRAQRDRADDSVQENRLLRQRLAESEKLLARQAQSSVSGRLSRLQSVASQPAGPGNLPPTSSLPPGSSKTESGAVELQWKPRL